MIPGTGFSEIDIRYLPATPFSDQYAAKQEEWGDEYLASIVLPADQMEQGLDEGFVHVDGALVRDAAGRPAVQHISAVVGRTEFTRGFREAVNKQTKPDGDVEGVYLPERGYRQLDAMVKAQLPEGVRIRGGLVVALAAKFNYALRPLEEGGEPLALPPDLHGLAREDELPLEALVATGDQTAAEKGHHTVNVIQGIYGHIRGGKRLVTARVGLVYDDDRGVPFSIIRQIKARRSGGKASLIATPAQTVRFLMQHAEQPS